MRYLLGMSLVCSLAAFASAAEPLVEPSLLMFAEEPFVCRFAVGNAQEKLAEFTRADETIDNWQKLVAVRHYPLADCTPAAAAAEVVKALQRANPLARHQLLVKDDGSEALLDFVTWPADARYAEFNAFRYLKEKSHPGLVSYQFAYRFTDSSPAGTEKFKRARDAWLTELREVDWQIQFPKRLTDRHRKLGDVEE